MNLWALAGVPEIAPGDDLPAMLAGLAAAQGVTPGDVLCIAQKIISKSEGRIVTLTEVTPGAAACQLADQTGKTPQLCQLILDESSAVIRRRGGTLICQTHHGFVCANAGIDSSNAAAGTVILLPVDADRSARGIQLAVSAAVGGRVGVVVTDTHGRAFRRGLVNVALGVAGFAAVVDHRGEVDREGRILVATEQALADELAAAAGVLMGKADGHAVVVVGGVRTDPSPGTVTTLLREPEHDLFRGA